MDTVQFPVYTPITQQTAGGRQVTAGAGGQANVALTNVSSLNYDQGLMKRLIMTCSAAPTGAGAITIKDASAGNTLFILDVTTSIAAGTVLSFTFDVPLRAALPVGANPGAAFHVDMAANTGTWRFFIDGYYAQFNSLS